MIDSPELMVESAPTPVPETMEREGKLEQAIEGAAAAAEAREGERAQFHESRGDRAELRRRYGGRGDIAEAIDRFVYWDAAMRQNPTLAPEQLASDYLEQFNLGGDAERRSARQQPAEQKGDDLHPGRRLDQAIDQAMEEVDQRAADEREFATSAEQRAALKRLFPQLSFSDAVKRIAYLDAELWRDPIATAQRIGASYGLPVTPLQHEIAGMAGEQTQLDGGYQQLFETLRREGELPQLEALAPDMTNIMRSPNFPWTGNIRNDLRTAHAVANRVAMEERSRALAKARRAAPVATDSGSGQLAAAAERGDALDGAIHSALAHLAD
jgi:hypothetical protein